MRFDFSHNAPMTDEEIARVEGVNQALAQRIYDALHGLGPQSPPSETPAGRP